MLLTYLKGILTFSFAIFLLPGLVIIWILEFIAFNKEKFPYRYSVATMFSILIWLIIGPPMLRGYLDLSNILINFIGG
jgi:hypothetical protein